MVFNFISTYAFMSCERKDALTGGLEVNGVKGQDHDEEEDQELECGGDAVGGGGVQTNGGANQGGK